MDVVVYALCKKLVATAISELGDVFSIKGTVPTVEDLPATGNKSGDIYLVGPQSDGSYEEYYWTASGSWELLGNTAPDLGDFITNTTLYLGEDGTGTIEDPAEGTIIKTIYDLVNSQYVLKSDYELQII